MNAGLCGREDRLIPPAYADAWQATLPNAKVDLVDGTGHTLPYELPAAAVAAVTAHP